MQIVNGYLCMNCTDVDHAKKNVDPAHPQQGPKTKDSGPSAKTPADQAVIFGGALTSLNKSDDAQAAKTKASAPRLDVSA